MHIGVPCFCVGSICTDVAPLSSHFIEAIENMQEAALGQTLEAIEKLGKTVDPAKVKAWIDDHGNKQRRRNININGEETQTINASIYRKTQEQI